MCFEWVTVIFNLSDSKFEFEFEKEKNQNFEIYEKMN
jgi:hypothetical protein